MNMERFYRKLDMYYSSGKSVDAEYHLKEYLQDAREKEDYSALLIVCNELGGFYRAMNRSKDAIPIYIEAIHALRRLGMFNTENHATTLINQATNYAVCGMTNDALTLFESARLIFEELGITTDFRIASLHNNISIVYQDTGQYDNAIEHLNKALNILCQLEDTEIEVATTYINMSQIKYQARKYPDALEYIEKALELFDSAKALTDTHYSVALETHGYICESLHMYADSMVSFQKAAMLVREQYGEEHDGYISLKNSIERVKESLFASESESYETSRTI